MESESINTVGSSGATGYNNSNSDKSKRKKTSLTALQKKELCQYKNANPNATNEEIGILFQIGKSTVGDILRAKEKWILIEESSEEAKKKRSREGEWPKLEEALVMWIDLANRCNIDTKGYGVCAKT